MAKLHILKPRGILFLGLTFLGLITSFHASTKEINQKNSALIGMVLLAENGSLDIEKTIIELKTKWGLRITSSTLEGEVSVLEIDSYLISITSMGIPIPTDEVKTTAEYNYFWENASKEATNHKGHLIITLMKAGKDPIRENLLFSQVSSSVLNHSKSIGIYQGGRSLVLKKDFYLSNVEGMSEENLPLYNWLYFGLREINGKNSAYTYGLNDFGKKEIEIINSDKSLYELLEMLFNISHYILASNVSLNPGETIGVSETQKLKITESKGYFLEGTTLKIEY